MNITTAGNFIVTVTDFNGCVSTSNSVSVSVDSFNVVGTLYTEDFGLGSPTKVVNSYTGWQNGSPIIYSCTSSTQSDVRNSSPSNNYTNPSGAGNVFMGTATNSVRNLIISGINTSSYQNITLSFGLRKENTGTDTLLLEVSSNGGTYIPLYFQQLTSFSTWTRITVSGYLPSVQNLSLRFSKNSTSTQFRIDDLKLSYAI